MLHATRTDIHSLLIGQFAHSLLIGQFVNKFVTVPTVHPTFVEDHTSRQMKRKFLCTCTAFVAITEESFLITSP